MLVERLTAPMDARTFIQVHQAEIWRYLRFLGCDPGEAEDFTQETFLIVLTGAESPRSSAYLRTVARNLFYKSKRHPLASLEDIEEDERVWSGFSRDDDGASYLEALRGCVESLQGKAKQVILLRFENKLSQAAMAHSLALGEEGVKTLLRRVKERLRDCVQRKLET